MSMYNIVYVCIYMHIYMLYIILYTINIHEHVRIYKGTVAVYGAAKEKKRKVRPCYYIMGENKS